jgi:hypothetical protein
VVAAQGKDLSCPSAASDWEGAQLLGVVVGTAESPSLKYFKPRPVTAELLALAEPALPEEVFRFVAPCRAGGCPQFRDGRCGVAEAAVAHLPAASSSSSLPRCSVRTQCRWWHEKGPSACRRCAFVVTADPARVGTEYLNALPMAQGPQRDGPVTV